MCNQAVPARAEPVAGPWLVLGQSRRAQVPQPVCEHAGRHAGDSRRQLPVREPFVTKLPDKPQRPPPTQHLEQLKKRGLVTALP